MYEMNTSNKRKEVNFMSEKKAKRLRAMITKSTITTPILEW